MAENTSRKSNCQKKRIDFGPIITQMDFGHTDPMFVLPYGIQAEIDSEWRKFTILENAAEPD